MTLFLLFISLIFGSCVRVQNNSQISINGESVSYKINFVVDDYIIEPMSWNKKTVDIINLPVPRKDGFVFCGWFFDKAFEEKFSKLALSVKNEDVYLYPKWAETKLVENGIYKIDLDIVINEETINPIKDQFGNGDEGIFQFFED